MSKIKTQFVCRECGHTSGKWVGNCPQCSSWNTFDEEIRQKEKPELHKARLNGSSYNNKPTSLKDISVQESNRFTSGMAEFDRVLGGGFMPGSFVLLGGDPGIGKSTIALQMAKENKNIRILYTSGEESAGQIKQRALRMEYEEPELQVFTETDVNLIIEQARKDKPDILVVDSIQTIFRPELTSMPGTVAQIRECAAMLMQLAKHEGITVLTIGHVTKEGDLAGPRVLEHMVDTVIQFEGDKNLDYRILRTLKNRFGPAQEIGVFEMTATGLAQVKDPSQLFLAEYNSQVSGNVVVCTMEGSRPVLLEVQALVTPSNYGMPQRTASGFDQRRLSLLIAVLEKRGGFPFSQHDVFLNIAGGMKLSETACDLGVACALVSSLVDKPVAGNLAFIGEVGLGAEVRRVTRLDARLDELKKMSFEKAVIPGGRVMDNGKIILKKVTNLQGALMEGLKI
ncbi:MAG: DNA repair protein RadA [Balneolales bacterium]